MSIWWTLDLPYQKIAIWPQCPSCTGSISVRTPPSAVQSFAPLLASGSMPGISSKPHPPASHRDPAHLQSTPALPYWRDSADFPDILQSSAWTVPCARSETLPRPAVYFPGNPSGSSTSLPSLVSCWTDSTQSGTDASWSSRKPYSWSVWRSAHAVPEHTEQLMCENSDTQILLILLHFQPNPGSEPSELHAARWAFASTEVNWIYLIQSRTASFPWRRYCHCLKTGQKTNFHFQPSCRVHWDAGHEVAWDLPHVASRQKWWKTCALVLRAEYA